MKWNNFILAWLLLDLIACGYTQQANPSTASGSKCREGIKERAWGEGEGWSNVCFNFQQYYGQQNLSPPPPSPGAHSVTSESLHAGPPTARAELCLHEGNRRRPPSLPAFSFLFQKQSIRGSVTIWSYHASRHAGLQCIEWTVHARNSLTVDGKFTILFISAIY